METGPYELLSRRVAGHWKRPRPGGGDFYHVPLSNEGHGTSAEGELQSSRTPKRGKFYLSLSHTYAHLLSLSRVFLCHAISPRLRSESSSRFSLFPDPLERLITLILLPFPIILVENEDTGAWERSYLLKSRGE